VHVVAVCRESFHPDQSWSVYPCDRKYSPCGGVLRRHAPADWNRLDCSAGVRTSGRSRDCQFSRYQRQISSRVVRKLRAMAPNQIEHQESILWVTLCQGQEKNREIFI